MGIFKSLFGGKDKPQSKPSVDMRDMYFGDMPLEAWPKDDSGDYPWSAFSDARKKLAAGDKAGAIKLWQDVANDPSVEVRHILQAWTFLRANGVDPAAEIEKFVYGVIVEVGLSGGVDLVIAYRDHAARYFNHRGGGVIWEHADTSLDGEIDRLIAAGQVVTYMIGPWDKERPGPPTGDTARINFLTPSGLHFGQAPLAQLSADPMAKPVMDAALALMQALIAKDPPSA